MSSRTLRTGLATIVICLFATGEGWSAQDPRDRTDPVRPAASTAAQRSNRGAARGTLPDPLLLDGSTQPAEKRPEQGMLGDFEMPGDENNRSGKVGGQQNPAGGGQQGEKQGGGGMPNPLAQGGQGGGGAAEQAQAPESGQAQQGGGAGGDGKPVAGQGDPNAKAEGIQVAELQKDPTGEGGAQGDAPPSQKPQQVAIGDPTMQIKTIPNSPSVVGANVTAGGTQQSEKSMGGMGAASKKGGGGTRDGKNVEKGTVIPAGL